MARCWSLKEEVIDPQNYIYTRVNTKGERHNYKCLEFRREACKATARTGVKEDEDDKFIYAVTAHWQKP